MFPQSKLADEAVALSAAAATKAREQNYVFTHAHHAAATKEEYLADHYQCCSCTEDKSQSADHSNGSDLSNIAEKGAANHYRRYQMARHICGVIPRPAEHFRKQSEEHKRAKAETETEIRCLPLSRLEG